MAILALTGPIGSGKTTFANFLAEYSDSCSQYESFWIIAELGDVFNAALARGRLESNGFKKPMQNINSILDIVHQKSWLEKVVPAKQLHFSTQNITDHPEWFEKLELYLSSVQNNPDLLNHAITSNNKSLYRSLLQWLGGYIIEKTSPTIWFDEIFRRIQEDDSKELVLISGNRYPQESEVVQKHGGKIIKIERPARTEQDVEDLTERARSAIKPDITIVNSGAIEELRLKAEQLLDNLKLAS